MTGQIRNVMEAICFIEDNLEENLDLETVARAVHYSKYHLHRMFTQTDKLHAGIVSFCNILRTSPASKAILLKSLSLDSSQFPAKFPARRPF